MKNRLELKKKREQESRQRDKNTKKKDYRDKKNKETIRLWDRKTKRQNRHIDTETTDRPSNRHT